MILLSRASGAVRPRNKLFPCDRAPVVQCRAWHDDYVFSILRIYHLMARGNGRQEIVRDDADRDRLQRTSARRRFAARGVSMLLPSCRTTYTLCSRLLSQTLPWMQTFLSGYANVWARRHKFSGHVFQGRYRTELVEDETYLWTVTRYVHLNPVRAGLVETRRPGPGRVILGMLIAPAGSSGWLTTICWRRGPVRLVGRTRRELTGGMSRRGCRNRLSHHGRRHTTVGCSGVERSSIESGRWCAVNLVRAAPGVTAHAERAALTNY